MIRALIFDLDDTLLATSRLLIPSAHRMAARAMIEAGLHASPDEVLRLRIHYSRSHPLEQISSQVAKHFRDPRPEIVLAGDNAWYSPNVANIALEPEVRSMLQRLSLSVPLFLVTVGHPSTQWEKLAVLKVVPLFKSIYVLDYRESRDKHGTFQVILRESGFEAHQCIVVGDRPDGEILAGHMAGMVTVRVRSGEHAARLPRQALEKACYDITSVLELPRIMRLHDANPVPIPCGWV